MLRASNSGRVKLAGDQAAVKSQENGRVSARPPSIAPHAPTLAIASCWLVSLSFARSHPQTTLAPSKQITPAAAAR